MLKFSGLAPELERLNELGYRLPLNDAEIKRMQNLNRSWSAASAQTTERFRYSSCSSFSSSSSSTNYREIQVQTTERFRYSFSSSSSSSSSSLQTTERFRYSSSSSSSSPSTVSSSRSCCSSRRSWRSVTLTLILPPPHPLPLPLQ